MERIQLKRLISGVYDPAHLLRRFIIVSLISWLGILFFMDWGVNAILSSHTIKNAERNAIYIGRELLAQNRDVLIDADSQGLRGYIGPDVQVELDGRMRNILKPFNIVKIKVFTPDQRILYSTEKTNIGAHDIDNLLLKEALQGQVMSSMESNRTISDLDKTNLIGRQIIETYKPVVSQQGKVIGVFEIYYDVTDDLAAADTASRTVAMAIAALLLAVLIIQVFMMRRSTEQLGQVQQNLQDMSQLDSLTGLYNRRHLEARLLESYAQLHSAGTQERYNSVGLLMIDLDHFKKINDEHGHLIGDEVLVEVSQRIKNSTRSDDIVSRYGGEEFVVVLPGSDLKNTRMAADRILQSMRKGPVIVEGYAHQVSVSIGATSITIKDRDPWKALERADQALYQAKQKGRDQIILSEAGVVRTGLAADAVPGAE